MGENIMAKILYEAMQLGSKEVETEVVFIVEDCKVYRNAFILKKELIKKLEEAFPENV